MGATDPVGAIVDVANTADTSIKYFSNPELGNFQGLENLEAAGVLRDLDVVREDPNDPDNLILFDDIFPNEPDRPFDDL